MDSSNTDSVAVKNEKTKKFVVKPKGHKFFL